jgi:hypothetical protein
MGCNGLERGISIHRWSPRRKIEPIHWGQQQPKTDRESERGQKTRTLVAIIPRLDNDSMVSVVARESGGLQATHAV